MQKRRRQKIHRGNAGWKKGVLKYKGYYHIMAEMREAGSTYKQIAAHINREIDNDVEDRDMRELLYVSPQYILKLMQRSEFSLYIAGVIK